MTSETKHTPTTMTGPLGHTYEVRRIDSATDAISAVCSFCSRVDGVYAGFSLHDVPFEMICSTCVRAAGEALGMIQPAERSTVSA